MANIWPTDQDLRFGIGGCDGGQPATDEGGAPVIDASDAGSSGGTLPAWEPSLNDGILEPIS